VNLDGLAPGFALARVDFAQIQNLTLHHPAIGQAAVFHHAPVLVELAAFLASIAAKKHCAQVSRKLAPSAQRPKSSPHAFAQPRPLSIKHLRARNRLIPRKTTAS
jgi:hypothetical protein